MGNKSYVLLKSQHTCKISRVREARKAKLQANLRITFSGVNIQVRSNIPDIISLIIPFVRPCLSHGWMMSSENMVKTMHGNIWSEDMNWCWSEWFNARRPEMKLSSRFQMLCTLRLLGCKSRVSMVLEGFDRFATSIFTPLVGMDHLN